MWVVTSTHGTFDLKIHAVVVWGGGNLYNLDEMESEMIFYKTMKTFFSNLFSTWEKCVSLNCSNFCRTTHIWAEKTKRSIEGGGQLRNKAKKSGKWPWKSHEFLNYRSSRHPVITNFPPIRFLHSASRWFEWPQYEPTITFFGPVWSAFSAVFATADVFSVHASDFFLVDLVFRARFFICSTLMGYRPSNQWHNSGNQLFKAIQ